MRKQDVKQMETGPIQDISIDKTLEEVDWEKLDVEGVEDEAELPLVAKTGPSLAAKAEPSQRAKWELPPSQMKLFQRGSDIEIVWKWFGWLTVLGTAGIVTLGWGALVLFPNPGALLDSEVGLFLLAYAAVGICLTYYTMAGWLNRTHIVVSRDKITVRHGPVPWLGNKEVSNVKQLNTEKRSHQSRSRSGVTRTAYTYEIYAVTRNGQSVNLVAGLGEYEQAHFIAQQIEKYLGS